MRRRTLGGTAWPHATAHLQLRHPLATQRLRRPQAQAGAQACQAPRRAAPALAAAFYPRSYAVLQYALRLQRVLPRFGSNRARFSRCASPHVSRFVCYQCAPARWRRGWAATLHTLVLASERCVTPLAASLSVAGRLLDLPKCGCDVWRLCELAPARSAICLLFWRVSLGLVWVGSGLGLTLGDFGCAQPRRHPLSRRALPATRCHGLYSRLGGGPGASGRRAAACRRSECKETHSGAPSRARRAPPRVALPAIAAYRPRARAAERARRTGVKRARSWPTRDETKLVQVHIRAPPP